MTTNNGGPIHRIGFTCDSLDSGVHKVQVLHLTQTNQLLTDSMDAGAPTEQINSN